MEELRATADAYYKSCDEDHKKPVKQFFNEMDRDSDGKVCYEEFKSYMVKVNCARFRTRVFFDELCRDKREYLSYKDVVTLFYIIYSGRPFCEECKAFVKGIYFTCVRCFEAESGYSFNVCPSCFYARSHRHPHKEFMDPFVLLRLKRKQYQSKKSTPGRTKATPKASNSEISLPLTTETKPSNPKKAVDGPNRQRKTPSALNAGISSSQNKPSSSTTMVVVPNPPRNTVKPDKALRLLQLAVAVGNILVTAQFCTIM